jgi:2-keto-4-pentenoate hydratase/2-oxohepta-3-ene-1,7-dioic acid hydratase in catechol pathway
MRCRLTIPALSFVGLLLLAFGLVEFAAAQDAQGVKHYLRFTVGDKVAYGVLEGDRVRQLEGDFYGRRELTETTYALEQVTVLVPTVPSKVIALAGNYKDHIGDSPLPKTPEPFYKPPSCLQRTKGDIELPSTTTNIHYEAEMVVVIGKRAHKVSVDDALKYVLGITCGNDVSARIWQNDPEVKDVQWWRAKGYNTFGPCGPFVAAGLDYNNLDMELRLNGEVRQKTNTRNQIHNVSETVSFISQHLTLEPGDLIFTGTPGKTKPMSAGDVVEVEIEGVGILRNRVVAGE